MVTVVEEDVTKMVSKKRASITAKAAQTAEYNARIRDEKVQNGGLTETEVNEKVAQMSELANEIESKTGKTVALHNIKPKSKIRFAQMIQSNVFYLVENEILTNAEKAFLFDIVGLVGFKSNCLVTTVNQVQIPLTQKEIAKKIKKSEKQTGMIINQLKEKGILGRHETSLEDNNGFGYAITVNPNIIFNGDKNEIEELLKVLFQKANKNKYLKKLPVKLI